MTALFIAYYHGKVVGAAAATTHNSQLLIKEFVTDRSVRNQGIGRHLMAGMAKFAAEAGNLEIHVPLADEPAIPFYERLGFEPVSAEMRHVLHAPTQTIVDKCARVPIER